MLELEGNEEESRNSGDDSTNIDWTMGVRNFEMSINFIEPLLNVILPFVILRFRAETWCSKSILVQKFDFSQGDAKMWKGAWDWRYFPLSNDYIYIYIYRTRIQGAVNIRKMCSLQPPLKICLWSPIWLRETMETTVYPRSSNSVKTCVEYRNFNF